MHHGRKPGVFATNQDMHRKSTAPTPQGLTADSASRRRPGRLLAAIAAFLGAILSASLCFAAEPLPRSVLILNQSTSLRPWPAAIIDGIRSSALREPAGATSFYLEHLDLYRFDGASHRDSLRTHFAEKYRDKPIAVIMAIGPIGLAVAVQLRDSLWPTTPIVFAAVDEAAAKASLAPGVTGIAVQMTLANMLAAAQAIVPHLKRFAIVGNRLEDQLYYRHFADELPRFSAQFQVIDLMGLPMPELRRRVATLPDDSAILYLGINSDPDRTYASAAEAIPLVAAAANRPIIVDVETFLGTGATGGFILTPEQIGRDAGHLAMRILNGERVSDIPMVTDSALRPVFDWRQLRRWNVSERELPAGSEILFRELGLWEQYRWQIILVATVIALQTALILGLLYERRRRRAAERAARNSMAELAHVNRLATAGELSASIAHEVNQPLTGIVAHANAGLLWLSAAKPNLDEARTTFKDIVEAGHHAAEVVQNIRGFVTKSVPQNALLDMNDLIRRVLALAHADLRAHGITVATLLAEPLPPVLGDRVQLKQVVMNLVMNAVDAMATVADRERILRITTAPHEGGLLVRIEDSGPGIAPAEIERVFRPFHTTKAKGMGMGLSISRSIVAAHHGRLWASPGARFGAVFCLTLPPAAPAAQPSETARPSIGVPESAPEPAA
jgi:signal transduction histidine kinase